MKKIYALAITLFVSGLSFGQTVLQESFDYTVPDNIGGDLANNSNTVATNNWMTQSASTTGTIDLVSGNLSYTGIVSSTGNKVLLPGSNATTPRDINRAITTTATTLYYSALINIIDDTQLVSTLPLTGNNSYFISFGATSGASVQDLAGRLAAVKTNTGANYKLLIQNNSTGTPSYTENAVDLTFGTTYLVVVKVVKAVDNTTIATLWVNPSSLGTTEPAGGVVNSTGTSTGFTGFLSIVLRNASATPKVEIDEIRIGETWADVTPPATMGINENNIAGLKVYPNPVVNGKLFISSDLNTEKSVTIYDVTGKQVVNTTTSNEVINVSSLNAGVYIVKITEEGKTATKKLVVQ